MSVTDSQSMEKKIPNCVQKVPILPDLVAGVASQILLG